jgi:flagellar biogenesis protein FliO
MPDGFWEGYVAKLLVVALMLTMLYVIGARLRRQGMFGRNTARFIHVIETTMLSQHAALYVIRAGTRYFVIGAGTGGIVTLAELAPRELEARSGST